MSPVETFAVLVAAGANCVAVPLLAVGFLAFVFRAFRFWATGGGEKDV